MRKKVVVIDYKLGNLFSVNQALLNVGLDVTISSEKNDLMEADALVLPGVGAFQDAMDNLTNLELVDILEQKVVVERTPLLGICLGLQLLFSSSEEFGNSKGMGFVDGTVKRFKNTDENGNKVRVPQIAWNTIEEKSLHAWQGTPLGTIKNNADMYFVHSYYVEPANDDVVLSTTNYGDIKYCSSIVQDNIFACQFHPEKSAKEGLKIYKNWSELNNLY
ncbi:imidazole glycerol phosphate synthase subunit HisH [Sphingobacterium siyangense]|uniref:imidazole glycerol phosphate synthase subunit HisH n=1 Tax=Sphingobacterium siyangense TaxID=459529 RepID=UPI002FDCAEA6